VTVVWAIALPAENANVEMKAATREAAKRCEDIMTYLARMPKNGLAVPPREFAQTLEVTRQNRSGSSRGIVHRARANNRHEGERSA
jgi:carbamoylphosphate synthase large subunit